METMEKKLVIKVDYKLTHFPRCIERVDTKILMENQNLESHGQLVMVKYARVISVQPQSCYIYRTVK